jgi:hypothetical protein
MGIAVRPYHGIRDMDVVVLKLYHTSQHPYAREQDEPITTLGRFLMQPVQIGRIAAWLGVVALFFSLLMVLPIIPNGLIFGITSDGALQGAIALYLMSIAFMQMGKKEQ